MSDRTYLSGASLAGMSPSRSRVKDDFYATPFYATEAMVKHYVFRLVCMGAWFYGRTRYTLALNRQLILICSK